MSAAWLTLESGEKEKGENGLKNDRLYKRSTKKREILKKKEISTESKGRKYLSSKNKNSKRDFGERKKKKQRKMIFTAACPIKMYVELYNKVELCPATS